MRSRDHPGEGFVASSQGETSGSESERAAYSAKRSGNAFSPEVSITVPIYTVSLKRVRKSLKSLGPLRVGCRSIVHVQ